MSRRAILPFVGSSCSNLLIRWRSQYCPWKSSCRGGTPRYVKRGAPSDSPGLIGGCFVARLQILTYDEHAMQMFEQFRKQKIKIGRTDLRIAATVLQHGATLVTENTRDFMQVPGLKIVCWSGR